MDKTELHIAIIGSSGAAETGREIDALAGKVAKVEAATRGWNRADDEGWKQRQAARALMRDQAAAFQATQTAAQRAQSDLGEQRRALLAAREATRLYNADWDEAVKINKQFDSSVAQQERAIGRLRGPLTAITSQILGLTGSYGSLFSNMMLLETGGAATVGFLAGVAAIGAAIVGLIAINNALTKSTREAQKAYDDYHKSLESSKTSPLATVGTQLQEAIDRQARLELMNARGQIAEVGGMEVLTRQRQLVVDLTLEYNQLDSAIKKTHDESARGFRLDDLSKQLTDLQRTYQGGFLDEVGINRLRQIRENLRSLEGAFTAPTKQAFDSGVGNIRSLIDQADQLLLAQNKTAGLWTKLSSGPIQQALSAVEAAMPPSFLLGQRSGQSSAFDPGTGFTSEVNDGSIPNILRGAQSLYPEILRARQATKGLGGDAKDVSDQWHNASLSIGQMLQNLGAAREPVLGLLGSFVTMGEQVALVVKLTKELNKPGVAPNRFGDSNIGAAAGVGFVASLVGIFSSIPGLFGESEGQRRSREIMEHNSERLDQLRKSLDSSTLAVTGNQRATAQSGLAALQNDPLATATGFGGVDLGNVRSVLAGAGTNWREFREFAEAMGVDLDTRNILTFQQSLEDLQKAINLTAMVTLKTFAGQLDLVNRKWAISGAEPLEKIGDLLDLVKNPQSGNARLDTQLGAFDFTQQGDRAAGLQFLLAELERARSGQLSSDLGGMSLQQYLDFLSQFGDLLNQANEQIKATVDNLRDFGKSLLLDQGLTTLSPAQQLAEARRRYEETLALAQGGDQTAANNLPAIARQFLDLSRQFNASSPAYAADFARVMAETEALAKMFEGQQTTQEGILEFSGQMVNLQTKANERLAKIEEALHALVGVQAESGLQSSAGLRAVQAAIADSGRKTERALQGRPL